MLDLQYFFARVGAKLGGDEAFSRFFRKNGIKVGKNCHIYSNILTPESFLITIGDNVTISNDVQLVTHDNSVCKLFPEKTDAFGEITIGDNCFIGAKSILLYGVRLPNNTIVAAGSVVTKSFAEEKLILGGNPARIIGRWEDFGKKYTPIRLILTGCPLRRSESCSWEMRGLYARSERGEKGKYHRSRLQHGKKSWAKRGRASGTGL